METQPEYKIYIYACKGMERLLIEEQETNDPLEVELGRMKQYEMLHPESYIKIIISKID